MPFGIAAWGVAVKSGAIPRGIARSITASARRFWNGSFCFFFQKEALWFYLFPPGKMDCHTAEGRFVMTAWGYVVLRMRIFVALFLITCC
jgi:hypothetical protein